MATIDTFQKIKEIRDREKNEEQRQYQQAVESFETKATELYEALKEKERAEELFNEQLAKSTIQAASFIQHQQYLERLELNIKELQPKVNDARNQMNQCQEKLTSAFVEVKKFEKLIERKQDQQKRWIKEAENKQMDDLSMQQFLNFQNR